MRYQVFAGGTIVCSAMVFYGLAQPSASEPKSRNCDAANRGKAALDAAKQSHISAQQCAKENAIALSKTIPERLLNLQWGNRSSNRLSNSMEAIYSNLLEQAQTSAKQNQFTQAITTLAGIPKNSRHYEMAQRLQEDWSQELVNQASSYYQQAKLSTAVTMLSAIPATSQTHDRAIELQQRWRQQSAQLNRAIAAKKSGDWQTEMTAIQSLEGTPLYQSLPVQELLQQAITNRYEPDPTLLRIATADLPPASAAPANITVGAL